MLRLRYFIFIHVLAFLVGQPLVHAQGILHTLRGVIAEAEVGVPDIEVVLSGTKMDTSFTDANGEFVFSDLPSGSYVITPVSDQYGFEPEQHELTLTPSGGSFLPLFNATTATSIGDAPDDFTASTLFPNAPNPFTYQTVLRYRIGAPGLVQLSVYDVLGRHISTLRREFQEPGLYEVVFVPGDLPAGIYFFRLNTPREQFTRSMILTK